MLYKSALNFYTDSSGAAYQPGVSAVLVGTAKPANLRRNIEALGRGPLPADTVARLRQAFDPGWAGVI